MSVESGGARRRIQWLRLAGTFLSLALLVYLFSRHWQEIEDAFAQLSLPALALCLLLTLISRLAVGSRWWALLAATDLKVSWGTSQRLTFAGLFASNFLPTTIGGDVVRLAGAIQLKIDGTVSAASLIVDRLVGMAGMALALPFGVAPLWSWFDLARPHSTGARPPGLAAAAFSQWGRRALEALRGVWQSLALWRSQPRALIGALLLSGIHQLCLYLTLAILLRGLNQPLPFGQVAGLWSFVYFVTLLPVSINGYGVQELSLTFFFSQVAGVSQPAALAVAVLVRTIQMLASLPGAAFVPAILAGRREEQADA
jgi:hypothetical protein